MKNNLEEIARRTGFSIATVSRTLNGVKWVSERTRRTILACAKELGCIRDGGTIAVIVPSVALSYYHMEMALYLESAIRSAGCRAVLIPGYSLDLIEEYNPAGAISLIGDQGVERLWGKKYEVPLVCVNAAPRHLEGIFSVYSNEEQGMRLLLEHLLSLGHRRIGMFGYAKIESQVHDVYVFRSRKKTFQRILSEYEEADSLIVGYQWGCWEYASALYRLLDKGISAIVAASETQMMKIFHLLSEVGVRVPQDVSLAGWLDSMDLSSGLPVTGIMQNYARLAQDSMEMLGKLLRKERVEKDCIVDYQFIAGGSTLPLKKGQTDFPRRRRNFPSGDSLLLLEKSSAGVI